MKTGRWARGWMVLLVAMLAMGLTAGCSDSDDDDGEAAAAGATGGGTTGGGTAGGGATGGGTAADAAVVEHVNVAGNWNGTRSSGGGSTTIQIRFEQQGGTLRGSYQDTSGFAGTLRGTIDGDDIQFTLTLTQGAPGDTWTFTGAANATGTALNGNMRSEAGTDRIVATK